jgi:hypothetical protein
MLNCIAGLLATVCMPAGPHEAKIIYVKSTESIQSVRYDEKDCVPANIVTDKLGIRRYIYTKAGDEYRTCNSPEHATPTLTAAR